MPEIRPATDADVDAVAAIEAEAFSNPWQPQTFRSLVSQGRALILVAEIPGEGVVGYAVLWWVLEQGELANLAVRRPYQGRRIGSALLDRMLSEAVTRGVETVFLEVRMSNQRAYDLYLSRGFTQVGLRRGYYRNPKEDARVLVRASVGQPSETSVARTR
ncbi:ribosomal protein S18-alanine N-acetyltransferase [Gemmatimonadota bacterium]